MALMFDRAGWFPGLVPLAQKYGVTDIAGYIVDPDIGPGLYPGGFDGNAVAYCRQNGITPRGIVGFRTSAGLPRYEDVLNAAAAAGLGPGSILATDRESDLIVPLWYQVGWNQACRAAGYLSAVYANEGTLNDGCLAYADGGPWLAWWFNWPPAQAPSLASIPAFGGWSPLGWQFISETLDGVDVDVSVIAWPAEGGVAPPVVVTPPPPPPPTPTPSSGDSSVALIAHPTQKGRRDLIVVGKDSHVHHRASVPSAGPDQVAGVSVSGRVFRDAQWLDWSSLAPVGQTAPAGAEVTYSEAKLVNGAWYDRIEAATGQPGAWALADADVDTGGTDPSQHASPQFPGGVAGLVQGTQDEDWGAPGVGAAPATLAAGWDDDGTQIELAVADATGQVWTLVVGIDGSVLQDWQQAKDALVATVGGGGGSQGPPGAPGPDVRPQVAAALKAAADQLVA